MKPLDNPTPAAMLSPVAVCCGSAGLTARGSRRRETAPSLDSSGFLLRETWQVLLWTGYVGGVMPCRFLEPGLSTRIVPSTLFDSGEAGLTLSRSFAMNASTLPANVSIGNVLIHQQDGLFSLNDLHKASGADAKHRPNYFLANAQTKALLAALLFITLPIT